MDLVPFSAEMLSDAGKLLAIRHRNNRTVQAGLPNRFENEGDASLAIRSEWEKPNPSGVAAVKDGQLLGYLLGQRHQDSLRGRHIWISLAGHAIAEGASSELYRELYAFASQRWVDEGYFTHYSLLPSTDSGLIDAWFRLGFGYEQVHGLLSLEEDQAPPPLAVSGVEIRLATPSDRDSIQDLYEIIRSHQAKAPVFAVALPEDAQRIREGYAALLDDPSVHFWTAWKEGRIISFQAYYPSNQDTSSIITPDNCVELGVAATRSEYRGQGINRALTLHGLSHAKEKGYAYCMTDWRMTNLSSSRFWPRQGFLPVAYRLSRLIDHRISWANLPRF